MSGRHCGQKDGFERLCLRYPSQPSAFFAPSTAKVRGCQRLYQNDNAAGGIALSLRIHWSEVF